MRDLRWLVGTWIFVGCATTWAATCKEILEGALGAGQKVYAGLSAEKRDETRERFAGAIARELKNLPEAPAPAPVQVVEPLPAPITAETPSEATAITVEPSQEAPAVPPLPEPRMVRVPDFNLDNLLALQHFEREVLDRMTASMQTSTAEDFTFHHAYTNADAIRHFLSVLGERVKDVSTPSAWKVGLLSAATAILPLIGIAWAASGIYDKYLQTNFNIDEWITEVDQVLAGTTPFPEGRSLILEIAVPDGYFALIFKISKGTLMRKPVTNPVLIVAFKTKMPG